MATVDVILIELNAERREVAGLVVPWGVRSKPESTTRHRFMFPGAQVLDVPEDPTTTPLLLSHDEGRDVGHAVRFEARDDGLYGVFRIDDSPEGDDALEDVQRGRWRGFSLGTKVEADCLCGVSRRNCECDVERGTVEEVSLVRTPAFASALIDSIALQMADDNVHQVTATLRLNEDGEMGDTDDKTKNDGGGESGATVLDGENAAMAKFEADLNERFDKIGEKIVDSQVKLSEGVNEAISGALKTVFESLEGSAASDRARLAAARIKVRQEEPVYRFDGSPRSDSMVRDFWRAQTERDHDAIERLRKFQAQQNDLVDLIQRIPPFARQQFSQSASFVDTTSASDVIPPGYRPDLFVNELRQGRPIVAQSSRGTVTDATPFVVPVFVSATGATGDHVEGNNPTPGTLALDQVTVSPGAISGSFQLTREIVDAANPAIDAIALAAMRESYNQQTEVKAYAALNGAAVVTADVTTTELDGTGGEGIKRARNLLARYPFTRFAAPTGAIMSQKVTTHFAGAEGTDGRPLLPSVGAQNTSGVGNAVDQGWFVDGLAFTPAWAVTENEDDHVSIIGNRADWWTWESSLLTFRFEEKLGPANIELALFAYYATAVLRPAGLFALVLNDTP